MLRLRNNYFHFQLRNSSNISIQLFSQLSENASFQYFLDFILLLFFFFFNTLPILTQRCILQNVVTRSSSTVIFQSYKHTTVYSNSPTFHPSLQIRIYIYLNTTPHLSCSLLKVNPCSPHETLNPQKQTPPHPPFSTNPCTIPSGQNWAKRGNSARVSRP